MITINHNACAQLKSATSKDTSQYTLNGWLFTWCDEYDVLRVEACDGRRLHRVEVAVEGSDVPLAKWWDGKIYQPTALKKNEGLRIVETDKVDIVKIDRRLCQYVPVRTEVPVFINGKFPRTDMFFPKGDAHLNVKINSDVIPGNVTCRYAFTGKHTAPVRYTVDEHKDDSPDDYKTVEYGVFMPMKVDEWVEADGERRTHNKWARRASWYKHVAKKRGQSL